MTRVAAALSALLVSVPLCAQAPAPAEWWRGAVCYEVFVRSFYDADGDGIGDLRGLTEKLDYIKGLGATCIWLMPIAQSGSYHGYDVTNYYHVDRDYGTNDDFKHLVAEGHRRGIRILVDLVLNHVSSEHPYFQSAVLDAASPYRDWFVWSPTKPEVHGWGHTVWHHSPTREEYYYGFFWSGMPDLNLGSAAVTAEVKDVARFWLQEMGVDGFRLDAVGHLFEHGDTLRHHPLNHPWLRDYAAYVRRIAPQSFTVGEVWDSTGAILPYYPDQLDAYFIFEVGDALVEAVRSGAKQRLVSAVLRAERDLPRGRWASFLRNHDQTRTLTELQGDVRRAKLAATLLFTLPGIPFVYYGEEIGMTGAKPDPRLRTPMHWALGPGVGFTRGVPWEPVQADSFTANVEAQGADSGSLLNHYRRLIHLRNANPALSTGELVPLAATSDSVVAYLRRDLGDGPVVLVVANLGSAPVSRVTLTSEGRVLPAGRYTANNLLGGLSGAPLVVRGDGSIRGYMPVRTLGGLEAVVLQVTAGDGRGR